MAKSLKILLKILLALVTLLVVVIIAIPMFINPNDYKQQIEQQVYLQTGSKLNIIGDIDVSIGLSSFYLPTSLAFELGKTTLSQPESFTTADRPSSTGSFFEINKIALNASLISLIKDNKLEVGKIILDQVKISLIKNNQGQANWESLSKNKDPNNKVDQTADVKPQIKTDAEKQASLAMPEIQIAGLEITNCSLSYDDFSTGQHAKLDNLSLNLSQLKENTPIKLVFSTQFDSQDQNLKGDFSITTTATLNFKLQLFKLQQATIELTIAGPAIPTGKNSTKLSADIDVDLAKQVLMIKNMNLDSYQLNLKGQFNVTSLLSQPQFKSQIQLAEFSPKELMKQLQITPPKMKNTKVLNKFSVNLKLEGNANQLDLTALDVVIDEIKIKGEASIKNLKNPSYTLKLDINKLYLDDYAMFVSSKKPSLETKPVLKKVAKKTTTETQQQPLIPIELIKSLAIDGQLTIGELVSNGVKMSQIVVSVKSSKGLLVLDPVQSDFYKGQLKLKTSLDVRGKIPKISFSQDFKQIDLGSLLFDATGTKEFTGTANISSQLTTQGNFQKQLIQNSNGKGKFIISNGHIAKLDILQNIRVAHALLKGQAKPTQKQQENTAFTELKGTIKIKNGVLFNKDLFSKSPLMQLTGAGSADLVKEYLNYTLKVKLLNSLQIDQKSNATDFRNKPIPYTIKGKFSELSQQADIKDILAQQAKSAAKKQLSKQLDRQLKGEQGKKIEEAIGADNLNQLKGLFKF